VALISQTNEVAAQYLGGISQPWKMISQGYKTISQSCKTVSQYCGTTPKVWEMPSIYWEMAATKHLGSTRSGGVLK
jgi:hypothetical protein